MNSLEEMTTVLNLCFGDRERIDFEEFSAISEEKTSDMVLSVLSLLRERLPCSENYWRYKRNYEMHIRILEGDQQQQDAAASQSQNEEMMDGVVDAQSMTDGNSTVKKLAKAHMSFVMPLAAYNQNQ